MAVKVHAQFEDFNHVPHGATSGFFAPVFRTADLLSSACVRHLRHVCFAEGHTFNPLNLARLAQDCRRSMSSHASAVRSSASAPPTAAGPSRRPEEPPFPSLVSLTVLARRSAARVPKLLGDLAAAEWSHVATLELSLQLIDQSFDVHLSGRVDLSGIARLQRLRRLSLEFTGPSFTQRIDADFAPLARWLPAAVEALVVRCARMFRATLAAAEQWSGALKALAERIHAREDMQLRLSFCDETTRFSRTLVLQNVSPELDATCFASARKR